mmetsp:Transcript_72430/g.189836  ORF Transcript_72430/g.189836 Transcript_72430/m.189836 type:complete len:262 (+) Transcript_72430:712-1497(+)
MLPAARLPVGRLRRVAFSRGDGGGAEGGRPLVRRLSVQAHEDHPSVLISSGDVRHHVLRGWFRGRHGDGRVRGVPPDGVPLDDGKAQRDHAGARHDDPDRARPPPAMGTAPLRRDLRAEDQRAGGAGGLPRGVRGRSDRRRRPFLHRARDRFSGHHDESGAHGDGLSRAAQGGHGPFVGSHLAGGDSGQGRVAAAGRHHHAWNPERPDAIHGVSGGCLHHAAWRGHGLARQAQGLLRRRRGLLGRGGEQHRRRELQRYRGH